MGKNTARQSKKPIRRIVVVGNARAFGALVEPLAQLGLPIGHVDACPRSTAKDILVIQTLEHSSEVESGHYHLRRHPSPQAVVVVDGATDSQLARFSAAVWLKFFSSLEDRAEAALKLEGMSRSLHQPVPC